MVDLDTPLVSFRLPDPYGEWVSSDAYGEMKAMLVVFMCNHCPFVKHLRDGLAEFAKDYLPRGLQVIGINSNDAITHPADSAAAMKVEIAEAGYGFPYLVDETQDVARRFGATCTPDFFLYDAEQKLAYRGQFDSSRPGGDVPVTGDEMRRAADAILVGRPLSAEQMPSIGCNIKWKPAS
jgi:thiol-disulfide isomerase/thioredoxin